MKYRNRLRILCRTALCALFPLFLRIIPARFTYYSLSCIVLFPLFLYTIAARCITPHLFCIILALWIIIPVPFMYYCRCFMHYLRTFYVLSLFFLCIIKFFLCIIAALLCSIVALSWIIPSHLYVLSLLNDAYFPIVVSPSPSHAFSSSFSPIVFITPMVLHNCLPNQL